MGFCDKGFRGGGVTSVLFCVCGKGFCDFVCVCACVRVCARVRVCVRVCVVRFSVTSVFVW